MALDAVVFSQDPFGYNNTFKDYFHEIEDEISGGIMDTHTWSYSQLLIQEAEQDNKCHLAILDNKKRTNPVNWLESSPSNNTYAHDQWVPNSNSSPEEVQGLLFEMPIEEDQKTDQPLTTRRKRRRTKAKKNKEEVENQRMTHIAVERNRRKQMNEYLAVLRSIMPSSYAQRGDQASIIGGAINFVKELEQLLQTLKVEKSRKNHQQEQQQDKPQEDSDDNNETFVSPFANFFTFPQYTSRTTTNVISTKEDKLVDDQCKTAAAADIEVTFVEGHANVKILAKRCSKQLVKLVSTFQSLKLNVQHLNVSTHDHMVLYSISVKVEEGCKLNSVDEIAGAVNEILHKIEEESTC